MPRSATASQSSSTPSIAELRAVTQPAGVLERASGEHWAGRLYMRRLSPYVTRLLLRTPLSANAVTWLMIPCGVLAALALTLPGIGGAIGALAFVQAQLLLDCCDGEVARWRGTSSPVGIYLDRIAHHVTEAALPVALGVRADGGWDEIGGWTTLGLVVAVLVLLIKAESHLVQVARAEAGRPLLPDRARSAAPRRTGLRRVRSALRFTPFFRAFVAIEATLLALAAALADALAGGLQVTRGLLVALVAVAIMTAAGHLVAILASDRLR
jgi:phosphatidylglycerophosphate synthase